VKSLSNPLPGAIPIPAPPRSRKSKPTPTLYGGANDEGYAPVKTSIPKAKAASKKAPIQLVLNNASTASSAMLVATPENQDSTGATTIDMTEFAKQLDPQSLATLENVLQSEQAKEIFDNLTLADQPASEQATKSQPAWDHSYTSPKEEEASVLSETPKPVPVKKRPGRPPKHPKSVANSPNVTQTPPSQSSRSSKASTTRRVSEGIFHIQLTITINLHFSILVLLYLQSCELEALIFSLFQEILCPVQILDEANGSRIALSAKRRIA